MKLEVLLSILNLNIKDLDKMNITSKCTIINQCGKNGFKKYKNYNIYSYDELGISKSRNRAFEKASEDIVILCDNDVVYEKDYEKNIINEFKNNPKADIIIFNIINPYRKKRINKKRKRVHFYNCLNYASYNIAFRRKNILKKHIRFNTMFGAGAKYTNGDDSLFIVDCLRNNLKMYTSPVYIGKIISNESTWFKGYNEKFFFDKGALFTAISKRHRKFLMKQFLLRHKSVLTNYSFKEAYKIMKQGSNDYLKTKE